MQNIDKIEGEELSMHQQELLGYISAMMILMKKRLSLLAIVNLGAIAVQILLWLLK